MNIEDSQSQRDLFSDLKFYVPPHIVDGVKLKNILSDNGGKVIDEDADEEKNALYILDSFEREDKLFSELRDKGSRIVSPKCIYDSIKDNKPLPQDIKYPLFARFMEGLILCLPKCEDIEDEIGTLIRYMGGKFEDTIVESTDYLIAKKVGSIQYQIAHQHRTPILSAEWVRECWRTQTLVDSKAYILPPFAGCVISVTGLSASTRNEIQRLAKAYGGEYTPNLTKRCTHLISRVPQGIKYRYALEWGIHCISVHWFFDSINSQACADETQYFLPMSEATRQALFNPLSTSTRDLNRLSPALRKKHLLQLQRRYGVRKRQAAPQHPYDLYIISTPFSRSASTIPGRRTIRPNTFRAPPSATTTFVMNPEVPPPPLSAAGATASASASVAVDLKEEEEMDCTQQKSEHFSEELDFEKNASNSVFEELAGNPETVAELYKLLETCNQTIAHYKELTNNVLLTNRGMLDEKKL